MASATSAAVFGNLEELHDFHAGVLYPELDRCGANPAAVARAFVENCPELRTLYSDQCRNMHSAHRYTVTPKSQLHRIVLSQINAIIMVNSLINN